MTDTRKRSVTPEKKDGKPRDRDLASMLQKVSSKENVEKLSHLFDKVSIVSDDSHVLTFSFVPS